MKNLFHNKKSSPHRRASFTLIELLVVLAIVAILSVVVIMTLNPSELLKQARDSNRLSDLSTLNTALSAYSADVNGGFMGTSTVVYVSLVDTTSSTCSGLGLPTLPTGYTYNCPTSTANLKRADGTGWIPVNFSNISFGSPLSSLPVDPINTTTTGNYYTYVSGGSFILTALPESAKQKTALSSNPNISNYPGVMATGNNLSLSPLYNPSGLVGYWNFDEGSGTTVRDSSGNGNNGVIGAGQFTGANCKLSNCFYMSNVNGATVASSASLAALLAGGKFTYAAWIYTTSSVSYVDLMGFQGYAPHWGYTFQIQTQGASGYMRMQDVDGVWQYATIPFPVTISTGTWHFLVLSHDASTGVMKAYLDGVPGNSATARYTGSTGSVFRLGVQGWSGFIGYMDDARLYDRALSAAEVMALYNTAR